ncbi:hypothetical protein vseg_019773 [Gypsophila vaccaria]
MEEGLLVKDDNEKGVVEWRVIGEEMKTVSWIAGPMVAVVLSQYLLQVVSQMMVGHLGELYLSSSAIAVSLSTVTGYSFLLGMASALETLSGQAYGAKQYKKLGTQTYTAIFSLALVSIPISILWINVGKLLLFIGQDPSISYEADGPKKPWSCCVATRTPLSMEIFHGIREFFRYAVPSATMVCLEWWSYELLILLSGLLPHPELETSVLSVCLTTISTLYAIPYGIGAAASTRVSNELGAGNPQRARTAAFAVMVIALANGLIVSSIIVGTRKIFGYCFSNEKEVIDYVTTMAPLVCVNVIMDSLQGVLSGIARGCGWQNIGTLVNLAAFYLVGIPIAAALGFWVQIRGRGLWIGILCGSIVQVSLLAIITSTTDWVKQASKARERLLESNSRVGNGSNIDERRLLSRPSASE